MLSFNRMERRSLATATGLVLLGTAVRLGFGPTPADTGWHPPVSADRGIEAISTSRLLGAVDSAITAEERAGQPLAGGEKIDPNFADESELRRLPGIGPARASAIVRDRRENGPFRTLEELERIPGLGPATVARLAPMLTLTRRPAPVPSSGDRVRLDRATSEELMRLPGIGPELAGRILEFRARRGGIGRVDDLLDVPGIGPATVEKIRNRVRIR
jgi:competence protein ComEA